MQMTKRKMMSLIKQCEDNKIDGMSITTGVGLQVLLRAKTKSVVPYVGFLDHTLDETQDVLKSYKNIRIRKKTNKKTNAVTYDVVHSHNEFFEKSRRKYHPADTAHDTAACVGRINPISNLILYITRMDDKTFARLSLVLPPALDENKRTHLGDRPPFSKMSDGIMVKYRHNCTVMNMPVYPITGLNDDDERLEIEDTLYNVYRSFITNANTILYMECDTAYRQLMRLCCDDDYACTHITGLRNFENLLDIHRELDASM